MPRSLKVMLAAEILASYVTARWMMRRREIRDVVVATRARLPQAPTGPGGRRPQ